MRRSPTSTLIVLVLAGCAAQSAGGPAAPSPAPVAAGPAFEIQLTASPGPGVRALLINRSGTEQKVLYLARVQPSRISVFSASKRKIPVTDTRAVQKFDRTVYAGDFETIAPGGSKLLQDERFVKDDSGIYKFRWGPFLYEKLEPGEYKIQITWESEIDAYQEGGKNVPMPGIWKGTVKSNAITVALP
jgi:hypothetical protein